MKHLNETTARFVLQSDDEARIVALKRFKWIGYTQAVEIIKSLDELIVYPERHRMPNILLVGDSNNGKTILLKRFVSSHEPYVTEDSSELIVPVLMIQSPPEPDEKRFYNSILEALFAPHKSSERSETRQQRVIHLLKKVKTKVLIIDEIHHVLAGTVGKQRMFLNVIKYLSNELNICLVCSGTRDAFNAIQTDPQLANRFNPKILKKWRNDEEYLRLLASFERILPLKKESFLIEGSLANIILQKSEGLIGEISKILELASIMAINTQIERINMNIIDNIDYISPSERKKISYKL